MLVRVLIGNGDGTFKLGLASIGVLGANESRLQVVSHSLRDQWSSTTRPSLIVFTTIGKSKNIPNFGPSRNR